MIMNQMAEYIFMKDPCLQFELTKTRPTQKSIKLFKYKRIDPFNEEWFRVFGERMVEIIRNTPNVISENKKQKKVYLQQCQPEIVTLYCELLGRRELLSENGQRYSESVSSSLGSVVISHHSQDNQMAIPNDKKQEENNQENMFWNMYRKGNSIFSIMFLWLDFMSESVQVDKCVYREIGNVQRTLISHLWRTTTEETWS